MIPLLTAASAWALEPAWTIQGGEVGASFGINLVALPDADGDGVGELAVLSTGERINLHQLNLLTGHGRLLETTQVRGMDYSTLSLAAAPNLDGDGRVVLALGGPNLDSDFDGFEEGGLHWFKLEGGKILEQGVTGSPTSSLGAQLIAVDLDRDGRSGFAVASSVLESGQAWLTDDLTHWAEVLPAVPPVGFGVALTTGDFNGDGWPDLAIGDPLVLDGWETGGSTSVYLGGPSGLAAPTSLVGPAFSDFGSSLAAGDFNGDGYDDLAVADADDIERNFVELFFGGPEGLNMPSDLRLAGASRDQFALGLLGLPDFNGDGYGDLAVYTQSAAWLYFGSPTGPGAEPDLLLEAPDLGQTYALTSSDLTGDGLTDVIGSDASAAGYRGKVWVYPGFVDADQDGSPAGGYGDQDDCNDADATVHPGATEVCNGLDDDCDELVDDADPTVDLTLGFDVWRDDDGDGFGGVALRVCWVVPPFVDVGGDCDDAAPTVHPGADERCNGVDDDCDDQVDTEDASLTDGFDHYEDRDGDTFGGARIGLACAGDATEATVGGDCDDENPEVNPAAVERCAPGDEDCNGLEGVEDPGLVDAVVGYPDRDGDGYGAELEAPLCEEGATDNTDCDDHDPSIHPSADDAPKDGIDADCDGVDPEPAREGPKPDGVGCTTTSGARSPGWVVALALALRRRARRRALS